MTPLYIDAALRSMRDAYEKLTDPDFDYHKLDKNSQEDYHELVAICQSITEKHGEENERALKLEPSEEKTILIMELRDAKKKAEEYAANPRPRNESYKPATIPVRGEPLPAR